MTDKPWIKPALEYGPLALFLGVFLWLRDDTVMLWGRPYQGLVVATLVFVPVMALATLAMRQITGKLSVMQVVSLVLVLVLGGMTVWLNDERFIKIKPTLLYLAAAGALGFSVATGRNWLGAMLGDALPLRPEGWRKLTLRMIGLFIGLAALNELVWRTMSDSAWMYFKIFGLAALTMAFFFANARLFRDYALPEDEGSSGP